MEGLLAFMSGIIGALIGTYFGARLLQRKQDQEKINIRKIAKKALDIFMNYAKQNKRYNDAANEFNNKLNTSEKRAVVVALHKLGVPFETPTLKSLDITNLQFKNSIISENEINAMIMQIENGNCDNQFFNDVESHFTSNLRINAIRSIGKRFVEQVHSKAKLIGDNPRQIKYPDDWAKLFSPGEILTLAVLKLQLCDESFFSDSTANPKITKQIINEIEVGIWDNYLFSEYETFLNIRAQHNLANTIQNVVSHQQPQ